MLMKYYNVLIIFATFEKQHPTSLLQVFIIRVHFHFVYKELFPYIMRFCLKKKLKQLTETLLKEIKGINFCDLVK